MKAQGGRGRRHGRRRVRGDGVYRKEATSLLEALPNVLSDVTPDGRDESDNVVLREWGTDQRKIGDDYQWHDDIARRSIWVRPGSRF